jgi:predicted GNAT family N-acyltransferase
VLFDHDNQRIISYYSTGNYSIQKSSLKSRFGFPTPQIPATLIGRLAVDKNYKGKGYGGITLAEALKQIQTISKITGIKIVLVDAFNESAVSFYKAYGFEELDDDKMKLFAKVRDLDAI